MGKQKQDYGAILHELADDLQGFISEELPDDVTPALISEIRESVLALLNFDKPKVMVYGIYNSGKSTLINALMKEQLAEVADRPTTYSISEYDHGDYILVDSPGVNAPVQHEAVTNEHLNKCHIILFVVSSKGGFEEKYNYLKMAELIKSGIPFIIVLNDRGTMLDKSWDKQTRAAKRAEHEQELREVQHKIIKNLIAVTGNRDITDNYEVYVLSARNAWLAIERNQPKLYEQSNVAQLDQRIIQLLQHGSALSVLRQPITNLNSIINKVEQIIAQQMQGTETESFSTKLDVIRKKQTNLIEEMRVLLTAAIDRYLDNVTNLYISGDNSAIAGVEHDIFQEIENVYISKLNDTLTYIERSFRDVAEIVSMIDRTTNLAAHETIGDYSEQFNAGESFDSGPDLPPEEAPGVFDFLKSRKRKEKEKFERLQMEADIINSYNENRLHEQMRIKQEARQRATGDLTKLHTVLTGIIQTGIEEKFKEIISCIQSVECNNTQLRQEGEKRLHELDQYRTRLSKLKDITF